MRETSEFTNMRDLMTGLAKAMNLLNPEIERHHEQTAYLALFVAREMDLPEEDIALALYSALLHDIGSIVVEAPQSVAEVEGKAREVSLTGARMLADLPGFGDIASVIGYCQCNWGDTISRAIERGEVPERLGVVASIVHLADVVSLIMRPGERVLNQAQRIVSAIEACAGTEFCPQAVEAFCAIASVEYVWMDLAHNPMFLTYFTGKIAPVSIDDAMRLTVFMSRLIDYRSPFTAMHSAGVAASAGELARLAGFDDEGVKKMLIAGNLHDVGKLAVPRSILEKPGKLTTEEFNVVKEHPYYTSLVLLEIDGFEDIRQWAANHHEKLTGNGYPFHFDDAVLDDGARIMAVADIFSAITEQRPYRAGMTREEASAVLAQNAKVGAICPHLVGLLLDNYEQVDEERDRVSRLAGKRYFESLGA